MEGKPREGGGALAAEAHTPMPVGWKPAGRLGVPTLGTWEWGSRGTRDPGQAGTEALCVTPPDYSFPGHQDVGFQALFPHF